MNRGMLAVWEDAHQLCELMNQQSDAHLHTRLQMLYLIRIAAATDRLQVAQLLGVSRNTVRQWLQLYERGGLEALLRRGQAPGAISSLPPPVIEGMRQKLAQPLGFASFCELQQWVEQTYHLQTTYRVIHYTATQLLGARLAVARRTHIKKEEGDEARFRESLEHRLRQAVLTPQPVRWQAELLPLPTLKEMPWPKQRIRAWTQDESRFGLITILRRRLTLRGIKPLAPYQHQRQSFYLYGSVEPLTGESFFLELPGLDGRLFQVFLDHFAQAYAACLNLLVLDQAPAHITQAVRLPPNVRFIFTPPYTPEVSPIERFWEDLKDAAAGHNPLSLNALSDLLCELIQVYTPAQLSSLTSYPFFKNAANALCSM